MPDKSRRLVHDSGQCEIDFVRRELSIHGSSVPIGGRAFEVLEVLARAAGDLVSKDQLMRQIWPGAVVAENTLHVHASEIRKALGPYRTLLKTVSGRGYRLLGDWVSRHQEEIEIHPDPQDKPSPNGSPASNIPASVGRLFGRAAALAHVRNVISAHRVVTLTGPGGIGKTSLAVATARSFLGDFIDGVWLIELAALSDPALVPSTVAAALELRLGAKATSSEAVARAIGNSNVLLLLDNCEHVIGAVATFVEIVLKRCPSMTILATSREILRVDGERVYHVDPLEVPAADEDGPDRILSCSAVELFVARMSELNQQFSPLDAQFAEIGSICRQLDGLPLAIEFAAARASILGLQQVAVGLRDRFALLKAGRRTALPRHQTLRAVLDWSYELLSEIEKQTLRRLSIFLNGFTLSAAVAVVDEAGQDHLTISEGIVNLVSRSLVAIDKTGIEIRYRLLETTRAYALEKLVECGDFQQTALRHAKHYLVLFEPFATEGMLHTALVNLEHYRREIDNLRGALDWAFGTNGDVAVGVALAAAAADFWAAVSMAAESGEWARKALAEIGSAAGTRHEMILQFNLGTTLHQTAGMIDSARAALARALTLATELGDFQVQERITRYSWRFSYQTGSFHDALKIARQYESKAGPLVTRSQAVADWLVGTSLVYLGEPVEATARLQQAVLRYPREQRSVDMILFGHDLRASASGNLSVGLLSLGLLDAAGRAATRAVEEARATDHPLTLCGALSFAAGCVFLEIGDLELVAGYSQELIYIAQKHGLRPLHASGLCICGSLEARRANPIAGIEQLRHGLAEMRQANYMLFWPYYTAELASALGTVGLVDDGIATISEALASAKEGYPWFAPEISRIYGELLKLRGTDDDAAVENMFRQSLQLAAGQQALYWELSATISLAEFLQGKHRRDDARAALAAVFPRIREGFAAGKIKRARLLMEQLDI